MTNNTDTENLAALEQLLSDVRPRARREHPAIAETINRAIAICRTRHGVHAGAHLELRAAIESIRAGRLEDAAASIEAAIAILERWAGT